MRRFKSRRRSFGATVRRARPIIRAAMGITLVKRVIVDSATIPDVSAANYDNPLTINLLRCIEAQDEEAEADGSTIADAPLYSRITGIRLTGHFQSSTASYVRWMLIKSPDNDISLTSLVTNFHNSNDGQSDRELRKMTIKKGWTYVNPGNSGSPWKTGFISKKALQRISPLRENDRIQLILAKDAAGTTIPFNLWGSIYVKANA